MRIRTLIDNIPNAGLEAEWGLALYIEYGERKILLDTGATGIFAVNAERMGVNLADVEIGVLSHAHDDHANGLAVFFGLNRTAKFYIRSTAEEDCYMEENGEIKYIGLPEGWLTRYADRIIRSEDMQVAPGIALLSHHTPGLEARGRAAGMYRRKHGELVYEDFSHEQSLIFETEQGLVVCNSCCHAGADTVIREIQEAYPGKKIHALIGGFHLFISSDEEVRCLAENLLDLGVQYVITGHCTGDHAYEVLKETLGGRLYKLHSGFEITF